MKKILFILGMLLSLPLKANELKCEVNYEYFKADALKGLGYYTLRDIDALLEYFNSTYYPMNFKGATSKKDVFYQGEWISKKQLEQNIRTVLIGIELMNYKFGDLSFGKPKINYLSDYGEICVVPVHGQGVMFDREISYTYDSIYIRNLQTDRWKAYPYSGIEKREDMDLLFPELLSKVRLSQSLNNNMDLVDYNIYVANELMEKQNMSASKEEMLSVLKRHLKPQYKMLKLNGYK